MCRVTMQVYWSQETAHDESPLFCFHFPCRTGEPCCPPRRAALLVALSCIAVTSGRQAFADLVARDTPLDFGVLKPGESRTKDLIVENNGDEPAVLSEAKPDCNSCIKVDGKPIEVLPHEQAKVAITYTTRKNDDGPAYKRVTFNTAQVKEPTLTIAVRIRGYDHGRDHTGRPGFREAVFPRPGRKDHGGTGKRVRRASIYAVRNGTRRWPHAHASQRSGRRRHFQDSHRHLAHSRDPRHSYRPARSICGPSATDTPHGPVPGDCGIAANAAQQHLPKPAFHHASDHTGPYNDRAEPDTPQRGAAAQTGDPRGTASQGLRRHRRGQAQAQPHL